MIRPLAISLVLLLSACQALPPTPATLPGLLSAQEAGVVIGTLDYPSSGDTRDLAPHALVRLSQVIAVSSAGSPTYFLDVQLDAQQQQGFFSGTLPAGVYTLDEAVTSGVHLVPATLHMPFEVRAGVVTDAGHFALAPTPARPALSRAR